jgi:thiamine-monophosphate kinase
VDELELIRRLSRRFASAPSGALGVGDDAAVLAPSGARALTVDASIEGVHFRRDFGPLEVLSARAFEAAASDLAAMGARFEAALLSFELPSSVSLDDFDAIVEGFASAAARAGGHVVGGNLARGERIALHTTAIGALEGPALTRSGARPGDTLFVSGPTGAAAAGLALLLADDAGRAPELVHAFLEPRARFDVARAIVGRAHAAIDLSDGLLLDLSRMLEASSAGAVVEAARLPAHEAERELENSATLDLLALRLTGGESYELLVAGPPELEGAAGLVKIGRIERGEGVTLLDERGEPLPLPERHGHVHT